MFCISCGAELREGSKFCARCGSPQEPVTNTASTTSINEHTGRKQTGTGLRTALNRTIATGSIAVNMRMIVIVVAIVFSLFLSGLYYVQSFGGLSGTYYYYGNNYVFDTLTFNRFGGVEAKGGVFAGTGVTGRYTRTRDGYIINFNHTSDGTFGADRGTLLVTEFLAFKKNKDVVTVRIESSSSLGFNWWFWEVDFVKD